MPDFVNKKSFTLEDVFESMLNESKKLLDSVPREKHGRLQKYIDITQRIQIQVKPENFSMSKFFALLDEYDGGLNKRDKHNYPYALPLVETEGEKAFAVCMRDTLQAVIDNRSKLDNSNYSWYLRSLMKVGLLATMPGQVELLNKRIDAFEKVQDFLPAFNSIRKSQSMPVMESPKPPRSKVSSPSL